MGVSRLMLRDWSLFNHLKNPILCGHYPFLLWNKNLQKYFWNSKNFKQIVLENLSITLNLSNS